MKRNKYNFICLNKYAEVVPESWVQESYRARICLGRLGRKLARRFLERNPVLESGENNFNLTWTNSVNHLFPGLSLPICKMGETNQVTYKSSSR